ncbi:hypothetical protein C8R43DRAFT_1244420 [Mycena crocata]|nr:hypothetical protein C8R43DRAFT_1244420 [Mycena crocata]
MSGALKDEIDVSDSEDSSGDIIAKRDQSEEAFPSSFCATPPTSAVTNGSDDDEYDSMLFECSQEITEALDEMEQPGFVPLLSQCASKSQPAPMRSSTPAPARGKCPVPASTAPQSNIRAVSRKQFFLDLAATQAASTSCGKTERVSLSQTSSLRPSAAGTQSRKEIFLQLAAAARLPVCESAVETEAPSQAAAIPGGRVRTRKEVFEDLARAARIRDSSGSSTLVVPTLTSVRIKAEPPSPTAVASFKCGNKKRKQEFSDSESDSEDQVTFKKPKPPFRVPQQPSYNSDSHSSSSSSPELLTPPSATPLSQFFSNYPKFKYDESGPASTQFEALRRVYKVQRKQPAGARIYQGYTRALGRTFSQLYGDDVDDLANWQGLCRAVRITPLPTTLKSCQRAIEDAHVNIIDLLDHYTTGEPVHRFPTEKHLSEYTLTTGKIFPGGDVGKGPLLKYLLRHIYHPPPLCTSGLGRHTCRAASLLVMGVAGGAVFPPIQGAIADRYSTRASYGVSAPAFAFVAFFAAYVWVSGDRQIMLKKTEPNLKVTVLGEKKTVQDE